MREFFWYVFNDLKWRRHVMATIQELKDAAAAKDVEVKTKFADLESKTGGASAADLDEVKAAIDAIGVTPVSPA